VKDYRGFPPLTLPRHHPDAPGLRHPVMFQSLPVSDCKGIEAFRIYYPEMRHFDLIPPDMAGVVSGNVKLGFQGKGNQKANGYDGKTYFH
jgi:hypothetical protein